MTTSALIMFVSANVIVTAFTIYYFRKVLVTPIASEEEEQPIPDIKSYDVS
ncbi:MAG: hypothetical protein KIPDCIKN_00707 [Haliscomenobacter sp.]|jgi:hypothetical protein|nr:hypothetical protein [Haliscomenobacter sp.]